MPNQQSNTTLADAADLILKTEGTIFITAHAKPDGDAFGSVVALTCALNKLGKTTFPCFAPPIASQLTDLKGYDLTHTHSDALSIPECDLYIVLDTGAWSQVDPLRKTLEPNLDKTLIIDHHLSGDIDAAHKFIDTQAAACAEIIAELLDLLDAPGSSGGGVWNNTGVTPGGDQTIAEALFVGIGSDTGWFRFSNTRPQTHRLAARLLEMGVDHADLYARLHQTERPAKLKLLSRALTSLTLLADERAAVMSLTRQDFADTRALEEETERLIDVPQQARSIQVVALVTESSIDTDQGPQPLARISFRSKPGPNAVNVADLAAQFGGGGHARAAGAKLQAPIDQAVQRVQDAIRAAFGA